MGGTLARLDLVHHTMKDTWTASDCGTLLVARWVKPEIRMCEDALKTHLAALQENARTVQLTMTTLQLYDTPLTA